VHAHRHPGTGKTTVAKLYAEILKDLGLLSKGELIVTNASDFIGQVMGQSEANTKKILTSSIGSVLLIDEA
jgi:SpoVK/Ycf46/Vps4 family AAA+-type ATPase